MLVGQAGVAALLAGFLFLPPSLAAQNQLHGAVTDAISSVPVPGAVLRVFAGVDSAFQKLQAIATSDGLGRFVLQLIAVRDVAIVVTRLGYYPDTLRFTDRVPSQLAVRLEPGGVVLPTIQVRNDVRDSSAVSPILQRSRSQLNATPAAAGVDDPVRALGFEPGVALANPYSARLAVRGSSPDQLGFFVDGFPILNPVQLGGAFSGVPAAAVSSLSLWGTNAPDQLSGFSGGALDVRTAPTTGLGLQGDATLNIMAAELALGWSPSESAGIKAVGRHSWLPMVLEHRTERDAFSLSDYLLSADISPRHGLRVFGLAYRSDESRGDPDFTTGQQRRVGQYQRSGQTLGAGIAFNLARGMALEARGWDARATASGHHLQLYNFEAADSSAMRNRGLSADLSILMRPLTLHVGASISEASAASDIRYTSFLDQLEAGALRSKHERTQTRAHASLDFKPAGRVHVHAGAALVIAAGGSGAEPTVSADYEAGHRWRLSASVASRTQLLFQLTDPRSQPAISFSTVDAWLVSGDGLDPTEGLARTTEVTGTATWSASDRLRLTGLLYLRDGSNHPVLDVSGLIANGPPHVLGATESAYGISMGGELALPGATFARLSYTWSRAHMETAAGSFPSEFDVPHRLTFFVARQPVRGLRVSVSGAIQSGQVYSSPAWGYQIADWNPVDGNSPSLIDSSGVLLYAQPNNARTRFTHRVDVQVGLAGQLAGMPIEVFAAALNVTSGYSIPPRIVVAGGQGALINRSPRYSLPPVPLIGVRMQF